MTPPAFDEKGWREHTEWTGRAPKLADVWRILNDSKLAPTFREGVSEDIGGSDMIGAACVQSLAAGGLSGSPLVEAFCEASGRNARPATVRRLLGLKLTKRASWKIAFANLVSGRFTELVFVSTYAGELGRHGLVLDDATTERSFLDYRLVPVDTRERFSLSVNVKNAGRQMEKAREFFGLDSDDTLPMATYKAFGAANADIPPLIYVYLVDWTLLERLRGAYWLRTLNEAERRVFRLMTSFSGFTLALEDDFVAATVDARLDRLRREVGYGRRRELPFRAISAARCHSIFYEQHERSPYVFIKKMNTDPNVHISIERETTHFSDLIRDRLATPATRAKLLKDLARTKTMAIPDPPV